VVSAAPTMATFPGFIAHSRAETLAA
jgi:hypothetical protein